MASWLCSLTSNALRPYNLNKVETVLLNSVRWRKRRWAPIAPTKLFKVRERQFQDPVECEELKVGYSHYRSTVRSLREYLKNELNAQREALTGLSHIQQEEQHMAWCMNENDRWNEVSAKFRLERETEIEKKKRELDLQELITREENQKELQEQMRSEILKIKEEAKNFATAATLESMIEVALNQRLNFSFAIDVNGNRYLEQPDGSTILQTTEENESRIKDNLTNENVDTKPESDENKLG